jgi:transposase
MWGVDANVFGLDGKPVYRLDSKFVKQHMRMGNGSFNRHAQSLYFMPNDGSERKHVFKGMIRILAERGISTNGLKRECTDFKCKDVNAQCCVWQVLYNQPDFTNIKSLLEEHCEAQGFKVIFLPKFHCKLNFLEQCWGMAKHHYCLFPRSKTNHKAALLCNVLEALNSVDLVLMRR